MVRLAQFAGAAMAVIAVALLLIKIFSGENAGLSDESIYFMSLFQVFLGGLVIYAGQLKILGKENGDKIFRASIAATLLFFVMAYRWFYSGV
ncbi:hypothetical protein O5O45_11935 [Hahella aquimaris]|uniref:hypothetical protein n=1 Tax=Hahella sp. HNIBRBA332 TaxID=3015983 RepID=UPI00273BE46B|nr:hypothetical protein [Hahella sp. HNIBRBA332]WLQ16629.1 hypothetical protein O5O45_11935 [Hahella sp. HNIBRBA332]